MKARIIIVALAVFLLISAFKSSNDLLTINANTISGNKIKTSYQVEDWSKNSKLISISITNESDKIEYIKDISIQLNTPTSVNADSRILYGSYQMGSGAQVQKLSNETQTKTEGKTESKIETKTESVLLLKNGNTSFFKVGVLTWEIFRAEISYSKDKGIQIVADGEDKPIKPGQTINFEKIVVESGDNWQNMLFEYGKQIAKVQKISPKKINQFKGWSTWDYYAQSFTEKDIDSNIKRLKELNVDANMIQIDGGWWKFRGDYLDSRDDLGGGMKGVAKRIKENGYTPGLHIDGFRAEKGADVYKAHPEWFLKDQNGQAFYTESQRPNRVEQSIYFDYSHPGAREYIKNVLKTMKEDWGYKYFKIDFICYGLDKEIFRAQKNSGLKEIHAYDETMTSMERTRAGLKAMREGMGDAFFLGCSSVFGPTLGIVDGLRTGGDISPVMEFYASRCLQNGGNFYLNKTVVQTDSDYLVVRSKEDEEPNLPERKHKHGGTVTQTEATMWANYVSLFGGIKISSDNLNTLRPERKKLIPQAMSLSTCERYIPIDFWDKAKFKEDGFNIMLGTNKEGLYLALFNWDKEELGIKLSNIPTDKLQLVNADEKSVFTTPKNSLDIKLKGHTSVIFKLKNGTDFDIVRAQIVHEFHK